MKAFSPTLTSIVVSEFEEQDTETSTYQLKIANAYNIINECIDPEDLKTLVLDSYPDNKDMLSQLPAFNFVTVGKIVYLQNKSIRLPKQTEDYLNAKIAALIKASPVILETDEIEEPKVRISSEEKNNRVFRRIKNDIEYVMDEGYNSKDKPINKLIKRYNPNGIVLKKLTAHFETLSNELRDARTEEYAEYYERTSNKAIKLEIDMVSAILDEIDGGAANARIERTNNKKEGRKTVNIDKQTRFAQYKRQDAELGVTGLTPQQIFNRNVVVVYNTKSSRIIMYVAEEGKTLEVKGTSIVNFDETKSFAKTIRKPEQFVKSFRDAPNVRRVEVLFDTLKTNKYPVRARLNEDTLILKVFP